MYKFVVCYKFAAYKKVFFFKKNTLIKPLHEDELKPNSWFEH